MSYTFSVKMEAEISDEMVEQVIGSAGYGIDYWASAAEVDDVAKTYTVEEEEDGTVYPLSYYSLARALWTVAYSEDWEGTYVQSYARNAIDYNDPGYIDSELGDVVVQVAAFGKLVYG